MKTYEIFAVIDGHTVMVIQADTAVPSTKTDEPGTIFIGDENVGLVRMDADPEYGVREAKNTF